jgi:hypothetical protein
VIVQVIELGVPNCLDEAKIFMLPFTKNNRDKDIIAFGIRDPKKSI